MAIADINPKQGSGESNVVTGHHLIKQAEKIAVHWWSLIECALEQARYGKGKDQPLPQWASAILEDGGTLHEQYGQHRVQLEMAHQALNLAEGKGHDYAYEIWTSRVGHRLEVRHESTELAQIALDKVKAKHPDAFIARVHVRRPIGGNDDPALLNTLIGCLWWAGTSFGDEEDHYTIQDSTGRTVTVPASILFEHKDVMARLSDEARKRIEFDLKENERKLTIRTAAKGAENV